MKAALGRTRGRTRKGASASISGYMQYFLASDVLYRLAEGQINAELDNQGISATVPDSVFMTDPQRWLDPLQVSTALAQVSAGKATSGSHGLALARRRRSSPATPRSTRTRRRRSAARGGPSSRSRCRTREAPTRAPSAVDFQLTGGSETITGTSTIPRLTAGSIQTASIPIKPAPDKNTQLTLEVTVEPVPGEQITNNNRLDLHGHLPVAARRWRGAPRGDHNHRVSVQRRIPRACGNLLR